MSNKINLLEYTPTRSCVVCRTKFSKHELTRYIISTSTNDSNSVKNNVVLDLKKNMKGRGYYLCNQDSCHEKFHKLRLKKNRSKKV